MNRFRKDRQQPVPEKTEAPRPLRQFVADEDADQPSMLRLRINDALYWFLPLVIFIVITVAGIFYAIRAFDRDGSSDGDAPSALSLEFHSGNVPDLLNAHLDAIGGQAALQQVRSVRYEGRLASPTGEYDFMGLLLMPDKGMLVTSSENSGSLKLMLNGEAAWQVIEQQDGSRRVVALEEPMKTSLKWSLRIHNSLRSLALEGESEGLAFSEIEFNGKSCYEVTKAMKDGSTLEAVLDKKTLYLLRTIETLDLGEGPDEFTVIYDDHRIVSGIVEPHKTRLYRNGKLDNEATVSSYRINPGLISSLFEVPDEVSQ